MYSLAPAAASNTRQEPSGHVADRSPGPRDGPALYAQSEHEQADRDEDDDDAGLNSTAPSPPPAPKSPPPPPPPPPAAATSAAVVGAAAAGLRSRGLRRREDDDNQYEKDEPRAHHRQPPARPCWRDSRTCDTKHKASRYFTKPAGLEPEGSRSSTWWRAASRL